MTERPGHPVALPADRDHFEKLTERADDLVVFLGAAANTDGAEGEWSVESGRPPDDRDLAEFIATQAKLKVDEPLELALVAQRARTISGERRLFDWLDMTLRVRADTAPSAVDRLLAGLPRHFRDQGRKVPYQMIVTTKYDGALEKAFREAREAYDVAIYMVSREGQPGGFLYVPWYGYPYYIRRANSDLVLPAEAETYRLERTVIVRLSCTVEDGTRRDRANNYMITEDDYIDFLSGRPVGEVVPAGVLAKLKRANYLFLGYTIVPWRLRVFLHRVWDRRKFGEENYWAVASEPSQLDKDLWTKAGVTLYQQSLVEYMQELYSFIDAPPGEPER